MKKNSCRPTEIVTCHKFTHMHLHVQSNGVTQKILETKLESGMSQRNFNHNIEEFKIKYTTCRYQHTNHSFG